MQTTYFRPLSRTIVDNSNFIQEIQYDPIRKILAVKIRDDFYYYEDVGSLIHAAFVIHAMNPELSAGSYYNDKVRGAYTPLRRKDVKVLDPDTDPEPGKKSEPEFRAGDFVLVEAPLGFRPSVGIVDRVYLGMDGIAVDIVDEHLETYSASPESLTLWDPVEGRKIER